MEIIQALKMNSTMYYKEISQTVFFNSGKGTMCGWVNR